MSFRSIRDLQLSGKRVLVRVDFNVPQDKATGAITNNQRIVAALPTIRYALDQGASVVLMSHLGRPDGQRIAKFSLKPVAAELEKLLGRPVTFLTDCVGPEVEAACANPAPGSVILLENLRFHIEEEGKVKLEDGTSRKADPAAVAEFRAGLSRLGDVYVNDAFGTAHRAHASTVGITKFVQKSAAGLLMEKELQYLGRALQDPEHPFVAILGGAKVSDKIGVIQNLLGKVDSLIIGGGMAYTFLKAQGESVGKSLVEEDKVELARELLQQAKTHKLKFLLPTDHIVADRFEASATPKTIAPGEPIPANMMALDIGPQSIAAFSEEIEAARTIIWNGPMGVFEMPAFSKGTFKIAHAVADNAAAVTIVGGGDSVAAIKAAGVADKITHISTGGGASLEFLEGKKLPGVEALTDK